jgi:hypothetical protein
MRDASTVSPARSCRCDHNCDMCAEFSGKFRNFRQAVAIHRIRTARDTVRPCADAALFRDVIASVPEEHCIMPTISHWLRSASLATLLLVALAPETRAAEPAFAITGLSKDALRYEGHLKAMPKTAKKAPRESIAEAQKAMVGVSADPRAAVQAYIQAVVAAPADAEAWTGLATALLAIKIDQGSGSERYELPVQASSAAWLGYERAKGPEQKAQALVVLHEAFKRRQMWRPAIGALKTSLGIKDDAGVRAAYDKLVAEKGFRLVDYKTDADAERPRLCLQFSERLATDNTDFAKFIAVDGKAPSAIALEGRQLCVDGLAHGKRYQIQVRAGLPSAVDETLLKSSDMAIYVRDRAPNVRATGRAYVLPRTGQQGLPLVSVNADALGIEVYRVGERGLAQQLQDGDFQRRLNSADIDTLKERTGAKIYSGELAVTRKLNEDVTTAFPVSEAIGALKPGAYVLAANVLPKKDDDARQAIQWFIVSDLGLTVFSGDDGVHGFVRSLATAEPVSGATIKLVARNNEVLGTATTNAQGYVRFDAGLRRGEGGLQPAMLSAETRDGDYAFLDLATAAFDLSDRGVKGREPPGPVDAQVFGERGVYRPGETVNLTALVRDRSAKALSLPVTAIILRPDGVEHRRVVLLDQGHGGRSHALVLGAQAMSGTWRVKIHTDPKAERIAETAFLVEDFLPERLELTLGAKDKRIEPATATAIDVAGRYLYGPPAAGLAIEGEIVVKPAAKDRDGLAGYRFGGADEKINPVRKPLEALPETGADGKAKFDIVLPAIDRTARALDADVIVRLRESGGRTIERTITLPVDLKQPRIGIKPLFANAVVGEGESATFDVILADGEGRIVPAKDLKWELLRLDQRYQWFNRDGQWTYDVQTATRRIASGSVSSEGTTPARISSRVDWGRYRLEVSSRQGEGTLSSVTFNAGYFADEAADSPDMLELALDKARYKTGEAARVKITSRMAGRAQIAVLGNGVQVMQEIDVKAGGAEVSIPISDAWGAGAYVTATLYRPMDTTQKRMPGRAIGLAWIGVDQEARTLKVSLDAPAKVGSGGLLAVPVSITGLKPGDDARVVVSAVDVGILNLTRFEAPKPESWFYGQRRLAFEIRDFYSRLIDGMRADRGKLRSGGDGAAQGMSMSGSPPADAIVSLHSGVVTVGSDGRAVVPFQMPDFNGTVRLSAVAWSADKLGSQSKDVIVRDPVALTVSTPRFLTLGDEARLKVDVHNVEGAAGAYRIGVTRLPPEGMKGDAVVLQSASLDLKPLEKRTQSLALKPDDVGRLSLAIDVTGPGGIAVKRRVAFDVKPPAGDIKRVTVATLAGKGGMLSVSGDLVQDLIAGRSTVTVNVGPTAGLDVAGLITELDRYPYGCAEQTTSRALPLVYLNDVARQIGLVTDNELRGRVQKAIERVLEMQDASGAFGIWGPADGDMWLTSYVTDFLTRAKEANYSVPARAFTQALDRLANFTAIAQDFEKGGETRAYALYVLARAGRAPMADLRYDVDTRLDKFVTPLAQAQLGAALAQIGDTARSERAFAAALKTLDGKDPGVTRRDYGSGLRDGAAIVTLVSEARVLAKDVPRLVDIVAKAYASRAATSTQEQAWMLLAAKALGDQAKEMTLNVNGQDMKGQLLRQISGAQLKNGTLSIRNDGDAPVHAFLSVFGAALTPEPAISKGFALERSYYTLDGKKVDLASASGGRASVKQNDRFVVVLKVEAKETGGRILLVDRLPAGFEIENPRLVDSGDVKTLDWLKTTVAPEHTDFRDDRFVAAFDFFGAENGRRRRGSGDGDGESKAPASTATIAYMVRAVSPGSFVHPAATVEDMYRPERYARTAAGRLDVTGR